MPNVFDRSRIERLRYNLQMLPSSVYRPYIDDFYEALGEIEKLQQELIEIDTALFMAEAPVVYDSGNLDTRDLNSRSNRIKYLGDAWAAAKSLWHETKLQLAATAKRIETAKKEWEKINREAQIESLYGASSYTHALDMKRIGALQIMQALEL